MILIQQEVASSNGVIRIVNFSKVFICFLTSVRRPVHRLMGPYAWPRAVVEGGRGEVNLPHNQEP